MKFCPNCETRMRLKFDDNLILCPKCGFSVNGGNTINMNSSISASATTVQKQNALRVMDGENNVEILPTINIDCPKCSNNSAVWWMLQTRSADEPTTQFYRCTKCNHTWRNYS